MKFCPVMLLALSLLMRDDLIAYQARRSVAQDQQGSYVRYS